MMEVFKIYSLALNRIRTVTYFNKPKIKQLCTSLTINQALKINNTTIATICATMVVAMRLVYR